MNKQGGYKGAWMETWVPWLPLLKMGVQGIGCVNEMKVECEPFFFFLLATFSLPQNRTRFCLATHRFRIESTSQQTQQSRR